MVITTHDVRIVDTEDELINKYYRSDKISMGTFEETQDNHIYIKGETGEQYCICCSR